MRKEFLLEPKSIINLGHEEDSDSCRGAGSSFSGNKNPRESSRIWAKIPDGQSSSCEPEPTHNLSLGVTLGLNEVYPGYIPSIILNQAQSLKSVPERPALT